MAKTPKKDINLYTLVIGPKKSGTKKGVIYALIGIAAVVVLGGSFAGVKFYAVAQEHAAALLEEKANDTDLLQKIANANEVASDISTMRTAGNVYKEVRTQIDGSQFYDDQFTSTLISQLKSCEVYTITEENDRIATITGLAYDGTALQISASSADSQYVSLFVTNLNRLGLFSSITYSGYDLKEDTYTYTVTAVFQTTEEATTEVPVEVLQ